MNVRELIEELSALDPDLNVIMSKDGEGNNFSPYADLSTGVYDADSTWSGQYVHDADLPEMKEEYGTESGLEWDELPKAVCLWPVN